MTVTLLAGPARGRVARGVAVIERSQSVLLAGVPPRCTGFVQLQNPLDQPLRVKGLRIEMPSGEARKALSTAASPSVEQSSLAISGEARESEGPTALDQGSAIAVGMRAKLHARQQVEARLELAVPLTAKPGSYEGTLQDEQGGTCPVTVHVFESRLTRLHPQRIPVAVHPGEKVHVQVQVCNQGNVAVELASKLAVRLVAADENWHRHLHRAASDCGGQGHAALLDGFAARLGASELAPLKGKLSSGAGRLEPGQTRVVQLEFKVPKTLPRGREFNAIARVGYAALTVRLTTMDAAKGGST